MDWNERRTRFRKHMEGNTCLRPGSVFDPISARIAEDLGFEMGMFAGSVASLTVLGAPDLIVLTLKEFAEQAYRICRAGNLPLMVDADHGYGNALNVRRTVEELETAGVSGMSLEDTDLPQTYGVDGRAQLISIEEGTAKLKAALDARQDRKLFIAGRTSAATITSLEDAVTRAKAYEAAGVDGMFFTGLKTPGEIDVVSDALSIPIILGSTPPALSDFDYLAAKGVRIALQGHTPFFAAVKTVYDTLKDIRDGAHPEDLEHRLAPEVLNQLTRNEAYQQWIKTYL